jgi:protein-tyrosine phosphatase
MRRVAPYPLWIGTAHDARNLAVIFEHDIQAIVDLAMDEPPIRPPRELVYLRIPLLDGAGNSPELLRCAVLAVEGCLRENRTTLVACSVGASRSPAIAACALVRYAALSVEQALRVVQPGDLSPALWTDLLATGLLKEA